MELDLIAPLATSLTGFIGGLEARYDAGRSASGQRGRPRIDVDDIVLSTTHELCMERGYANVSIDDIAARAGIGKATIYRRYPTKQDAALAAFQTLVTTCASPAETLRAAGRSLPPEVLSRWLEALAKSE